ncbi:hypothetical protein [Pseudomonas citronellolis]|uniref:hypothetical protein n=1 Tax=Pseudomonas citronellolis TaxID=53408 RepID=UPI0021BE6580|nr:hypothetical protein [Pseudomonas citronellolis]UXJ55058.1 hypothetical protein N5P21_12915 [Pseudomonas citronellolis]
MHSLNKQMLFALRTAAFNNSAAADLLRHAAKSVDDLRMALTLERAANQLDLDADTLEVFVVEILGGRIRRIP